MPIPLIFDPKVDEIPNLELTFLLIVIQDIE